MGKYRSSSRVRSTAPPKGPHAIWRGIGCFMMLLIPVISIAAAKATIDFGVGRWPIPVELLGVPRPPDFFYKSSGLMTIFSLVTGWNNFYAIATASIIYMIPISSVISLIYGIVYNVTGPSRYGPTDEPPPKIKTKKYTR